MIRRQARNTPERQYDRLRQCARLVSAAERRDTIAQPLWSPNGRRIGFVSERDGNGEIYVMNADGSGQRNLTRTRDRHEGWFVWSPGK
jgi:Tol biopolymer transport system component